MVLVLFVVWLMHRLFSFFIIMSFYMCEDQLWCVLRSSSVRERFSPPPSKKPGQLGEAKGWQISCSAKERGVAVREPATWWMASLPPHGGRRPVSQAPSSPTRNNMICRQSAINRTKNA